MKSPEEIDQMQAALGIALSTLPYSPQSDGDKAMTAIALAAAEDTLNWVLGHPSKLSDLQKINELLRTTVQQRAAAGDQPDNSTQE